jgi:hypothetical protein
LFWRRWKDDVISFVGDLVAGTLSVGSVRRGPFIGLSDADVAIRRRVFIGYTSSFSYEVFPKCCSTASAMGRLSFLSLIVVGVVLLVHRSPGELEGDSCNTGLEADGSLLCTSPCSVEASRRRRVRMTDDVLFSGCLIDTRIRVRGSSRTFKTKQKFSTLKFQFPKDGHGQIVNQFRIGLVKNNFFNFRFVMTVSDPDASDHLLSTKTGERRP